MARNSDAEHRHGLTRRGLLHAGACSVCAALTLERPAGAAAAGRVFDGCFISAEGYRQFRSQGEPMSSRVDGLFARNRHFRSTGDRRLDQDLDRALSVVADLFTVNPAFGFYDPTKFNSTEDPESMIMNAWATPEATNIPGTWGTVGFGWDLFHKEFFDYDSSGTSIMTIIAHEFGHIWQQRSGNIARLQTGFPRKSEINADFLAGYFLGTRKRANPNLRFQKSGELFQRLGRAAEGRPERTHGNTKERLDAAEAGFRAAYVDGRNLAGALRAGMEYVSLN